MYCYALFTDRWNLQANAGDSRSVLGVKGRAKPLSFDHKPQNDGAYKLLLIRDTPFLT